MVHKFRIYQIVDAFGACMLDCQIHCQQWCIWEARPNKPFLPMHCRPFVRFVVVVLFGHCGRVSGIWSNILKKIKYWTPLEPVCLPNSHSQRWCQNKPFFRFSVVHSSVSSLSFVNKFNKKSDSGCPWCLYAWPTVIPSNDAFGKLGQTNLFYQCIVVHSSISLSLFFLDTVVRFLEYGPWLMRKYSITLMQTNDFLTIFTKSDQCGAVRLSFSHWPLVVVRTKTFPPTPRPHAHAHEATTPTMLPNQCQIWTKRVCFILIQVNFT